MNTSCPESLVLPGLRCIVRPEQPGDFAQIHELVRLAFAQAAHSDGDEAFLVKRLRHTPEYIPELALVATEADRLIAHLMFSKLRVGEASALALAPLSVLPSHQGRGLGGALIRHGHKLACALGFDVVVLLGHADYYPRFGYKPASLWGIRAPFDVPDEAFMAISLSGVTRSLPGTVVYSSAFFPEAD